MDRIDDQLSGLHFRLLLLVKPARLAVLMVRTLFLSILMATALPVFALNLGPPSSSEPVANILDPAASYSVAIGPASFGTSPLLLQLEGPRLRQSWKIPREQSSMLALLEHVRTQLDAQDHSVIYACDAVTCGGFDFRNSRPVLPLPAMYVDLGTFQYLSAEGINSLAEVIISQNAANLYLQVTMIGAGATQALGDQPANGATDASQNAVSTTSKDSNGTGTAIAADQVETQLNDTGKWVLDALRFTPGLASVVAQGDGAVESLARFLLGDPNRRIALVGHSDWVGSLESNQRLSRARAATVAKILVQEHGVPAAQIETHGIGYLSPRNSNQSDAGRQGNRRVEVVLLPDASP